MLSIKKNISVYIAVGVTDMRKSINGLSLLVQEEFDVDLFSGCLFAFCNRRQDIVKILYWAENGFCIWMKMADYRSVIAFSCPPRIIMMATIIPRGS